MDAETFDFFAKNMYDYGGGIHKTEVGKQKSFLHKKEKYFF